MQNAEFLRQFHQLQLGVTYQDLVAYPFGSFCYSVETTDPSENHCLSDRDLSVNEVQMVEAEFIKRQRNPAFYFEKSNDLNQLVQTLTSLGYLAGWEDAWLFYKQIEVNRLVNVESLVVKNEQELAIFLSTFSKSFQENDPQNPHGSMDERLENTREVWRKHQNTGRLEYYVFFQNSQPVATSALTSYNQIGYIDAVGSLKEVRGQGFGKAATLFAVQESIKKGNHTHCLCTIENTYPHEFYKRIGFEHRFTAAGYIRNVT